jgi:hypothetical protein
MLNLLGSAVRGTGNIALPAGVIASVTAHVLVSPVLIFGWGRSRPLVLPAPAGACRCRLGPGASCCSSICARRARWSPWCFAACRCSGHSVDTSGCAANSAGHFEIVFTRLKEIGPDIEFREQFVLLPPSVKVEVDFAADEAVGRYRIDNITPCPCGG